MFLVIMKVIKSERANIHFRTLNVDIFNLIVLINFFLLNQVLPEKPFVYLNVEVLREYLAIELRVEQLPWRFNLENAIDDWILLCFFVGNDFLPHLPSLEIREGAIDSLISIWKRCLPLMGGYITNNGSVSS